MLHLQDGEASVVMTPEHGGAVLGWMDDHRPVLRGWPYWGAFVQPPGAPCVLTYSA
jgi:hypothetical protein